jgi:hypothetical protein
MVHLGARHLTGLVFAIAFVNPSGTSFAGYVQPNLTGMDLGHKGKVDRIINGATGNTGSLLISDEMIEVTFDYVPEGTSIANALASAWIPEIGAVGTITTAPVIKIGLFADAFNCAAWIYEGDATLSGKPEEKWNGKIPLRRYVSITVPAAITT